MERRSTNMLIIIIIIIKRVHNLGIYWFPSSLQYKLITSDNQCQMQRLCCFLYWSVYYLLCYLYWSVYYLVCCVTCIGQCITWCVVSPALVSVLPGVLCHLYWSVLPGVLCHLYWSVYYLVCCVTCIGLYYLVCCVTCIGQCITWCVVSPVLVSVLPGVLFHLYWSVYYLVCCVTCAGEECSLDPGPYTPAPSPGDNTYVVKSTNVTCIVLKGDISLSNITYTTVSLTVKVAYSFGMFPSSLFGLS